MYGPTLRMVEGKYQKLSTYKGTPISKEEIIGHTKKAFPLNSRFELKKLIIPPKR